MVYPNTFRYSLYAAFPIVILTLTGIFQNFESRAVIEGELFLNTIILMIMVGGTAYLAATSKTQAERTPTGNLVNAIIGSAIVASALALIVIFQIIIGVSDLRFFFQNLTDLNGGTLTAGQIISFEEGQLGGLLTMIGFCLVVGAVIGAFVNLPNRLRETLLVASSLTVIIGLVSNQINTIIALPDALIMTFTIIITYAIALRLELPINNRLAVGFAVGAVIGLVLAVMVSMGALEDGGILRGTARMPRILNMNNTGGTLPFVAVMGIAGIFGAVIARAAKNLHDSSLYFVAGIAIFGILNWQNNMTFLGTALVFGILAGVLWFVPLLGKQAEALFEQKSRRQQRNTRRLVFLIIMGVMLIAPQFMGLYISNVFNQIALFAIMGIGLNVMIGYTGLLDLGYVASFAIGAYTLGILTTPNPITCGGPPPTGLTPDELRAACTGIITFWAAWPVCVIFSALTGMLLGIPVLRLRGDYLAIVTLGFGEIINRIILSNDFRDTLGGAQGISPIPSPVLNLSGMNTEWLFRLNNSTSMYYLFLFSVILTAFIVFRLANSRTGRAWRAVRADEDVAQAMGINLVNTKLLAFGISSAFAGLGGAVFGASVQGIFPNSFTLLVSINVLSLIIIGGMGSIPGVLVGALILIGLPELLRELDAYRLLAFGALLVLVMIVKPEGLLPPQPTRLSEVALENQ